MIDDTLDLMDCEPQHTRTKKRNLGLADNDVRRHVRALVIVARNEERRRKREERGAWL